MPIWGFRKILALWCRHGVWNFRCTGAAVTGSGAHQNMEVLSMWWRWEFPRSWPQCSNLRVGEEILAQLIDQLTDKEMLSRIQIHGFDWLNKRVWSHRRPKQIQTRSAAKMHFLKSSVYANNDAKNSIRESNVLGDQQNHLSVEIGILAYFIREIHWDIELTGRECTVSIQFVRTTFQILSKRPKGHRSLCSVFVKVGVSFGQHKSLYTFLMSSFGKAKFFPRSVTTVVGYVVIERGSDLQPPIMWYCG